MISTALESRMWAVDRKPDTNQSQPVLIGRSRD